MYTHKQAGKFIPANWPSLVMKAPVAFNLSSFALSLLLVFRTNTSYGRFDEARKLWGGCVNRSRDLARQAATWLPGTDPADVQLRDAFFRWLRAFPWILKNHLREKKAWQQDLQVCCGGGVQMVCYQMLFTHQPKHRTS